jgi:hypothetical protein
LDLTVIDMTGVKTEQVSVPDNIAASRIVGRLAEVMGLPSTNPDGRALSYRFQHEASGREIGEQETLAGAGVRDNDTLRLVLSAPSQSPPTQQLTATGQWSRSIILAVVAFAVAVGAALTAILLSGSGNPNPSANANSPLSTSYSSTFTSAGQSETESSATETTTATGNGVLPAVPAEQMQSEIQKMLLEWHEDVVQSNYRAAWNLLSHRKQAQESSEYGYATWAKNQATLRPYLNPAGLQVTVQSTEPTSGIAQVNVTGMSWDKPGAHCSEWSGITWVKYEEGTWRYDPGYSTTPQREREWKSRFSELLGGRC